MNLPDIRDVVLDGKTVLLRADLNVPFRGDVIADHSRLHRCAATLDLLIARGARVVVMAHRGRPNGLANPNLSNAPIVRALSDAIGKGVRFAADCVGELAERHTRSLPAGGIVLLENLRFHAAEEANDRSFALLLSVHGDLYVNDAPSSSSRSHASLAAIVPLMRAYAGPQLIAHVATLPDREAALLPGVKALMSNSKIPEEI